MSGFDISTVGIDEAQKRLLEAAKVQMPETISRIFEQLGEHFLGEAKVAIQSTKTPHARFAMKKRNLKKGGNRNYIEYTGSSSENSVDSGELWTSLIRGAKGNIWTFSKRSQNSRLAVGSTVGHAKLVHDGYKIKKRHWVPGVIDGSGNFRYQKGAKTGIMVAERTFKGIKFFEVAQKDLEKVAPEIIKFELRRFADEFDK